MVFYSLLVYFSDTFEEDKIIKLISILSKDIDKSSSKETFINYPYIYMTHIDIIKTLNKEDINNFIELVKYYDLESYEITMLENVLNSVFDEKIGDISLIKSSLSKEVLDNNYLNVLVGITNEDKDTIIQNNVYHIVRRFINKENNKIGLFNKKGIRRNIEEKLSFFNDILSEEQIEKLKNEIK